MTRVTLALAVLLAAGTTAGCGGYGSKSKSGSGGGKTTIAGVSANDHGSKSVSGSARVELDNYYFNPTVLKAKPGTQVTLQLKNEGSVEHNFTVDGQGIDTNIGPGKSASVTVTMPKSGAISFYCKFHKSMGMAGALESGGSGGMTGSGTTTGTTTGGYTSTGKGY